MSAPPPSELEPEPEPEFEFATGSAPSERASAHSESMDETMVSLGAGVAGIEGLPLERGDTVGRYVVLEEIGRGAMGVVMAAYDPELDRRIALKLMRVGGGRRNSSARLLREAQAMAKLAHPNVITVHDVGTSDGDVFIAMEYIGGGSLRAYLAAKPRRFDEIVRRFIEAGEGLAAAHRQGIVHRDFKPDNVLVREDGRACVGDFGLARRDEDAAERVPVPPIPIDQMRSTLREHPANRNLALLGLTATGAAMGTPAYMAPEQHVGSNVDHRSDQFAFCVALWEALVGERPYVGSTLGAIALNVMSGRREPFPRDSAVPSVIRAALERGLSTAAADRFADMDELLARLRMGLPEHRRTRSRGAWVLAGVLGSAAIAVAVGLGMRDVASDAAAPTQCSRAHEQLAGVWDTRRDAAKQAFADAKLPYAARSFERAASALDAMQAQWIDSHTRACEATRVYGEQSEQMLDRRMTCLAERRAELAAVAEALEHADAETIADVDALLLTIAPISSCDDLSSLAAGVAPPSAEQREAVEALRARLAVLEVRRRTAGAASVRESVDAQLELAEQLGYAPTLAEALHMQAKILDSAGEPEQALSAARRAVAVGVRCGHRHEVAEALSLVAWIEGTVHANVDNGLWLLELAAAESAQLGDPPLLAVRLGSDRASILTIKGEYEAALQEFERVLAIVESELGPNHVRAADLRFNIAGTQHYLGHNEQAEQGFRSAFEVYARLMGPDHPEVAQCHNNLSVVLSALGKGDEAEQHAQRAIELYTATGDQLNLAGAYATLSDAVFVKGDYPRALELAQRAYAMKLDIYGPDHPITIGSLGTIADAEAKLGLLDEARSHYREAIERLAASMGPDHPRIAEMQANLAALSSDPALDPARTR